MGWQRAGIAAQKAAEAGRNRLDHQTRALGLRAAGGDREKFLQALSEVRGNQRVTSDNPEATYDTLEKYGYDLSRTLDDIRPGYEFNATCQGSVPEAITAFLEGEGFEDSVRKAVSIGGDSDTIAAITGSIAEGFYGGVPEDITAEVIQRLDDYLRGLLEEWQEWRRKSC